MPQDWFAQNAAPDSSATGGDWFASHAPGADPLTQANPLGVKVTKQINEGVSAAAEYLNPIPMIGKLGQAIIDGATTNPKATAQKIVEGLKSVRAQQDALLTSAEDSFKKGDYVLAARHAVNWLIPFAGPAIDASQSEVDRGEIGKGVGHMVGLALSLAGPKVLEPVAAAASKVTGAVADALPSKVGGFARNTNPVEAEAVAFGQRHGVPIDAATATNNSAVRGVQAFADRSLGGSVVATGARAEQQSSLATLGEQLAAKGHAMPVTGEQAGQGATAAVQSHMDALGAEASAAYDKLRGFENDPKYASDVPTERPLNAVAQGPVKLAPVHEVVMDDLFHAAKQDGYKGSREQLSRQYAQKLAEARDAVSADPWAHDIVKTMQDALGVKAGNKWWLNPGEQPPVPTKPMGLAVYLGDAKEQLKPLSEHFDRMKSVGAPLQGAQARAATALKGIMDAPDWAPLSAVDGALGELKAMARSQSDIPAMRNHATGQAIKQLEDAVQLAAATGGPEVVDALKAGRKATVAKYAAADVLDALTGGTTGEGGKVFNRITARQDTSAGLLRQLNSIAPAETAKVGRAVLDNLLEKATQRGGFQRGEGILRDWEKLGPETKRLLYKDPAYVSDLDNFFRLAQKMGDDVNRSGSGHQAALAAQAAGILTTAAVNPLAALYESVATIGGGAAVSKLLRSKLGVKLLTEGLTFSMPSMPKAVAPAAKAAWRAQVLRVLGPAPMASHAFAGGADTGSGSTVQPAAEPK